ncbi:MAG: hypothetical protein AB1502_17430 [Thermodesulfobacteriota bacterium]
MPVITRKEFLTEVMKMAELESLRQADMATRAVVALLKREVGIEIADAIANVLSPDLREGWESVKVAPSEIIKVIK